MDKYLIYGLIDPRNGQLKYIGKSSNGLKRARSHAYPGYLKKDRTRTGNWIKSLKSQNLKYNIVVLETYKIAEELSEAEIWNIAYWKSIGAELYNHTLGGEGCLGRKHSEETKRKLSEINKGNKNALGKRQNLTDEQRAILAERARARSANPEIRTKIAHTLTGRKLGPRSEDIKRKLSRSVVDQNGVVYPSIKIAAKSIGCNPSSVSNVLAGRISCTHGFVFKYCEVK